MHLSWQALFFALILLSSVSVIPLTFAQVSPLKQLKSGIMPYHVYCKEGFMLIVKLANDNPACVKPTTATKLSTRGWVMVALTPIGVQSCPTGQTSINGECVPTVQCPSGLVWSGVNCQTSLGAFPIPLNNPQLYAHPEFLLPVNNQCPLGYTFIQPNITLPNGRPTGPQGLCMTKASRDPSLPFSMYAINTCPNNYQFYRVVEISYGYPGVCFALTNSPPTSWDLCFPNKVKGNLCVREQQCPPNTLPLSPTSDICIAPPVKNQCDLGYVPDPQTGICTASPNPLTSTQVLKIGQQIFEYSIKQIMPSSVTVQYSSCYPLCNNQSTTETIQVGKLFYTQQDCFTSTRHTIILVSTNETTATFSISSSPFQGKIECPICLSADSMIKTPNGDVNVKDIRDGMTVWSTDLDGIMIKSHVIKINSVFVGNVHKVIDLKLADGRELYVSPNHPTYDGRIIADLKVGVTYDRSTVKSIELVQYKHQFTFDILPDSQTGNYFANGILVGSTLK